MNRWLKLLVAAVVGVLVTQPGALLACTVCYGADGGSGSALGQGMGWGIFALLCTVVAVLGGIAAFFVYVIRRGNALAVAATTQVLVAQKN